MTTTAANSSGSGSASPPRSALKFVNLESQCRGSSTEHPRILEGTMSKERHSPSGHVHITSLTLWAASTRFRFVTRYSPSSARPRRPGPSLIVGPWVARRSIPGSPSGVTFMVGDRAVTACLGQSGRPGRLSGGVPSLRRLGGTGPVGRRHRVQRSRGRRAESGGPAHRLFSGGGHAGAHGVSEACARTAAWPPAAGDHRYGQCRHRYARRSGSGHRGVGDRWPGPADGRAHLGAHSRAGPSHRRRGPEHPRRWMATHSGDRSRRHHVGCGGAREARGEGGGDRSRLRDGRDLRGARTSRARRPGPAA